MAFLKKLEVNNFNPYLIKDPMTISIGLEYFCDENDDFWNMSDENILRLAENELEKINFIKKEDILKSIVIKVNKSYPAYFGSYKDFYKIRDFTDKFDNLFLIGRNGMHRYNNMDHSMLSAITAVDNIIHGIKSKSNIWDINTEKDYHETKYS